MSAAHLGGGLAISSSVLNAATQAAGAQQVPTSKTEFEEFVKNELAYHKAMSEMYETLLSTQLLGVGEQSGAAEMLRTLLVAGFQHIAGQGR